MLDVKNSEVIQLKNIRRRESVQAFFIKCLPVTVIIFIIIFIVTIGVLTDANENYFYFIFHTLDYVTFGYIGISDVAFIIV